MRVAEPSHKWLKTSVERAGSSQHVQQPLVDSQWCRGQRTRPGLDESPMSQRSCRRQRAPMRVLKCGQSEAESRVGPRSVVLSQPADGSEAPVEFKRSYEDDDFPLKIG